MRTVRDALLSTQKYVDVIFNDDPKLYEIRWGGVRWTAKRWQSKGALLVSDDQWNALRYFAYQEVLEPLEDLTIHVLMRLLYEDPRAAILALGLPALPVPPSSLVALDTFNRANVSPLDGNWTSGPHGALGVLPDLVNNAAQPPLYNQDVSMVWGGTIPTDGGAAMVLGLWVGTTVDTTVGADATLVVNAGVAGIDEVQIQLDTTGYVHVQSVGSAGQLLGVFDTDTYPAAFQTGDIIGLKFVGPLVTAYYLRGGVETDIASMVCSQPATRHVEVALGMFSPIAGTAIAGQPIRCSIDEVDSGVPGAGTGGPVPVAGSRLPDAPWEVRIAQERGEFIRNEPVALVYLVGPPTNTGSAKYAEWTQAMAVHCYPPPQSTVDLSTLSALDVEIKLQDAFRMRGVGLGHPLRVPLFDYADVLDPMVEDSEVRFPSDFLSITSFDTERLPDAQDPRRIRVVANFQARWRSTGRVATGRKVTSVITEVGTVL